MKRVYSIAFIDLGVVLMLPHAASAATANIILSISGCEAAAVQADRLFALVRTELAPRSVMPTDGAHDDQAPHLFVRLCQGSANGVVIALQSAGAEIALRQLDLSDVVGDLRARTLAVALAELVASAPVEANPVRRAGNAVPEYSGPLNNAAPNAQTNQTRAMAAPPMSAPGPQTATATPARPPAPLSRTEPASSATRRPDPLHVAAGAALREFFNPNSLLIGPWLSVAAWRLTGEAQFLTTKQNATLDNATLGSVTLYDANLAAAFRVISFGSTIAASANVRGEAGITWAKGNTHDASKADEKFGWVTQLGVALDVAFETSIQRHWGLELHVQGGGARGVMAQALGSTEATTRGVFVGAGLGLRFAHFI